MPVRLRFHVSQGLAISPVRFSQLLRSSLFQSLLVEVIEGFRMQPSAGFSSEWAGKISRFSIVPEIVGEDARRNLILGPRVQT